MTELNVAMIGYQFMGKAHSNAWRQVAHFFPEHPYMGAWWPPGHLIGYEHSFTHTVLDLVRAIASQTLPTPNFEDGVKNQRVLDAIERSSGRGFLAI